MKTKTHKVFSRNTKKRTIKKALKSYTNQETGERKESSIERKVRVFLESANIPHQPEKFIEYKGKWKAYDFLVTDGLNYTFLIECDGWWHGLDSNGEPLPSNKLLKIHKKNQRNDKRKNKIAKQLGIPLLRLKESDIKNNFQVVKSAIQGEIERQMSLNISTSNI